MAADGKELIVCPNCRKTNRVPAARLAEHPNCGSCGAALFQGHPTSVDVSGFERHVATDTIPVLVDVWAPWCGPCRAMGPMFERAAQTLEPRMRLLKLNMDEAADVARKYQIQAVPTLMLLQGGRLIAQEAGARDSSGIVNWARGHMS